MAIRCWRMDCEFNHGGWCSLYMIEIDENGRCIDYKPKSERREEVD